MPFFGVSIRHLNPLERHLEKITKVDKKVINELDYGNIEFPVSKKDFGKIENEI